MLGEGVEGLPAPFAAIVVPALVISCFSEFDAQIQNISRIFAPFYTANQPEM
jgi:hypothetical protein